MCYFLGMNALLHHFGENFLLHVLQNYLGRLGMPVVWERKLGEVSRRIPLEHFNAWRHSREVVFIDVQGLVVLRRIAVLVCIVFTSDVLGTKKHFKLPLQGSIVGFRVWFREKPFGHTEVVCLSLTSESTGRLDGANAARTNCQGREHWRREERFLLEIFFFSK